MGQVIPLLQNEAFDPETLSVLARSFKNALEILEATGEIKAPVEEVSEKLAQRLVELGRRGERDETRLTIEVVKFLRAHPPEP